MNLESSLDRFTAGAGVHPGAMAFGVERPREAHLVERQAREFGERAAQTRRLIKAALFLSPGV